ncbi:hypothetical protein PR048_013613 [Dryococelus australis]|uniref:Uncharacterized protein n=1 Tax=Dryococelus australis TaxID=614101 RepID=A0ABQ9HSP1_9NEOP|nr:hypothetical protein PR048_013613 [Dryococelus australis]
MTREKEITNKMSQKSMLIVYVRVVIEGFNLEEPLNLFTDSVELEFVTAKGIFSSSMSHLQSLGFAEEFLSEHLISLTYNGTAVMFGSRSGVATMFKEKFPSIVVRHCACHIIELSINDAIKEVCAKTLEIHILKGGRILSLRLVCFQPAATVAAVWQKYEEAKEDRTRDEKDCAIYEEVILCLQERNIDLYKAHLKVKDLVEVFEKMKSCPGSVYRKSLETAENLKFYGYVLHKKGRLDDPPISPNCFLQELEKFDPQTTTL